MLESHRDDEVRHRRHTDWLLSRISSWLPIRFSAVLIGVTRSKIIHLLITVSYEIALAWSATIFVHVLIDLASRRYQLLRLLVLHVSCWEAAVLFDTIFLIF